MQRRFFMICTQPSNPESSVLKDCPGVHTDSLLAVCDPLVLTEAFRDWSWLLAGENIMRGAC